MENGLNIFAKRSGHWQQVISHCLSGCVLGEKTLQFDEIWQITRARSLRGGFFEWNELEVPLPSPEPSCIAFGMTYLGHQRETGLDHVLRFNKYGPAVRHGDPLVWRDFLDYETEIGLLIHRSVPGRFGFTILNDLTDRGSQVMGYSKRQPTASFTSAKSFPGALRVGPLLAIGDESDWKSLEIRLKLDGVEKQFLKAADCILSPSKLAATLQDVKAQLLLVATGTSEGVLFQVPTPLQKLALLFKSKFSIPTVKKKLLSKTTFLQPCQKLEFESAQLGYAISHISPRPS